MRIDDLAQPPLETSLLGVVRGAFDHYGIEASTPRLYGASGHAFVANIHEQLCPSGPYCWKAEGFERLLGNLGVVRKDLGSFHNGSTAEERAAVEADVREHLDRGVVCSVVNMDNQLIAGYDDDGLALVQPWADMPVTPKHLTYGTWHEFGEEVHANFFAFERKDLVDARKVVHDSLAFAYDLYSHPYEHTTAPYGIGPDAYRNWIAAVKQGHGKTHGAWWNATVWSECRQMAGAYLEEIAVRFPDAAEPARDLAARYATIAENLKRVSDKEMAADEKIAILEETAGLEREAVARIPLVIAALASPS
jgi:hypothetical protein